MHLAMPPQEGFRKTIFRNIATVPHSHEITGQAVLVAMGQRPESELEAIPVRLHEQFVYPLPCDTSLGANQFAATWKRSMKCWKATPPDPTP
jgi:hypothetical protein